MGQAGGLVALTKIPACNLQVEIDVFLSLLLLLLFYIRPVAIWVAAGSMLLKCSALCIHKPLLVSFIIQFRLYPAHGPICICILHSHVHTRSTCQVMGQQKQTLGGFSSQAAMKHIGNSSDHKH